MKARVCWKIGGMTGKGELIEELAALECVAQMNAKYGSGTHWVEYS